MSEQIEEIFAYYGKQRDKSSQEMVLHCCVSFRKQRGALRRN